MIKKHHTRNAQTTTLRLMDKQQFEEGKHILTISLQFVLLSSLMKFKTFASEKMLRNQFKI
jgi:hypothetical protein